MEKRKAFRDGGAAVVVVVKDLFAINRDDDKGTITTENAAEKLPIYLALKGHNFATFHFWFDGCGPARPKEGEPWPKFYTANQLKGWVKDRHITLVETWVKNRKTGQSFPAVKWKISAEKATGKSEKSDTRIYI